MLAMPEAKGCDINPKRVDWAKKLGMDVCLPEHMESEAFDTVYVCPGSQVAFDTAMRLARPGARICMFAPMPPGQPMLVPQEAYFKDISISHAYSCGPEDTHKAWTFIGKGLLKAEQVVSHFISLDELPKMYEAMRRGEILKPMVVFK
jgi:L-iditol 2-dehydrogenase